MSVRILVVLVVVLIGQVNLLADAIPYMEERGIWYETGETLVIHSHNWWGVQSFARPNRDDPKAYFTKKNDRSFIEVFDKKTSRRLWRMPCPAFTSVWISPDENYVFGISTIKRSNPYQFVVFDRAGNLVRYDNLAEWPNFDAAALGAPLKVVGQSETVTNWVHWFDQYEPEWAIVSEEGVDYFEFNSRYMELSEPKNGRDYERRRLRIPVLPENPEKTSRSVE